MAAVRQAANATVGERRQNPARLFAAYSVYHHSNPNLDFVRPSMPDFMRPLPLSDAVRRLMDDSGHGANQVRKHAAATLAHACAAHPQRRELVRARNHLLGDQGRHFEKHQKRVKSPAVAVHLALDDGTCDIIDHKVDVHFDPRTFVTRVQVTVETTRPIDQTLAASADPRAWATPPNDFFSEVSRVQPDGDSYTYISDDRPVGNPWHGLFYERAQLAWDEMAFSVFENILQVDFAVDLRTPGTPLAPAIAMDFRLWECIQSRMGLLQRHGGLDVDEGYYHAWGTKQGTAIDTVKAVRYTNPPSSASLMLPGPPGAWQFINYTAPAVLGYWMDELACKGACLHVPQVASPSSSSRPARAQLARTNPSGHTAA